MTRTSVMLVTAAFAAMMLFDSLTAGILSCMASITAVWCAEG